jgi:hypothetical protein
LYQDALQIPDITTAWWGNLTAQTGRSPDEHRRIINDMMDVRHDVAHGKWKAEVSASECMDFLAIAVHLAMQTDKYVEGLFPPNPVA